MKNETYTDLEHPPVQGKSYNVNDRPDAQKLTHYDTGAKRDNAEGKEDYIETTSWLAMQAYARYMTAKAKVYGSGNWRKGIPVESYEQSLMRHIQKYLANKYDGANLEPNEDHLCAALFNLQGLIHEREKAKWPKLGQAPTQSYISSGTGGNYENTRHTLTDSL